MFPLAPNNCSVDISATFSLFHLTTLNIEFLNSLIRFLNRHIQLKRKILFEVFKMVGTADLAEPYKIKMVEPIDGRKSVFKS